MRCLARGKHGTLLVFKLCKNDVPPMFSSLILLHGYTSLYTCCLCYYGLLVYVLCFSIVLSAMDALVLTWVPCFSKPLVPVVIGF
jgi:hypothetical protein